ncbi:right-handed parallel beta-helix repeat-containing protein, partial [Klebsiella pneumoniae]|nr:right-handed parallel beta-helix repeat-containing protein [Klebsiella pneumoniae]
MSEINEIQQWEDGIPFITRSDKVEGGNAGKINIQTRILANRTRYLKNQLEAYNGLVKSGELPFSDFETAQEFIDAGKIPAGSLFSVRSDNPDYWVDECVNRNGKVTATGKHLLSESAITARIN